MCWHNLFSTNKDEGGLSSGEVDILNKIDLAYMKAYSIRTVENLRDRLTSDCLNRVVQVIHTYPGRYFADAKFRKTAWSIIKERDDGTFAIRKDVEFSKIKISGLMSINAAEDYSEMWIISRGKNLMVHDIVQLAD